MHLAERERLLLLFDGRGVLLLLREMRRRSLGEVRGCSLGEERGRGLGEVRGWGLGEVRGRQLVLAVGERRAHGRLLLLLLLLLLQSHSVQFT